LNILPTALQSPMTEIIGINSPFSRNLRTHFVRMMVLDNVINNGRVKVNPLWAKIKKIDMLDPQPNDVLSTPYLVMSIDFDAVMKTGDDLPATLSQAQQNEARDNYCREIWGQMEKELRSVFKHCFGFDDVKDGEGFANFIRRCQVETTMSFNDYWHEIPTLKTLPLLPIGLVLAVPLIIAVLGLIGWIFGMAHAPGLGWLDFSPSWVLLGGLLLLGLALWLVKLFIYKRGKAPMPPGKYADLPAVLKSLYLQQKFTDFAIKHQLSDAEKLYKDFGKFIENTRPGDKMGPTQKPGVIALPGRVTGKRPLQASRNTKKV